MSQKIVVEKNVEIPLRDGTITRGNVYRPDTTTAVPAILVRTPYGKDLIYAQTFSIDPVRTASNGYAIIYQDTRGRYESDGSFYPYRSEAEDGYDSVEWVATQSWCDGSIGMSGLSYLGAVQWLAAIERPPHLKTIIPTTIGSQHSMDMMAFTGGAFKLGYLLFWITAFVAPQTAVRRAQAGEADEQEVVRVLQGSERVEELAHHRPLSTLPLLRENRIADFYFDWMEHSTHDTQHVINRNYQEVETPALNVGGWYDYFLGGTLENYVRMRREGATSSARDGQRLLIGPWDHVLNSVSSEYDFGAFASTLGADFTGYQLEHLDFHLRSKKNDSANLPRVRIFVMGENVWRDEDDWPLNRARQEEWFLHSTGNANRGEGGFSPNKPAEETFDTYLYDPRDPAPTVGGAVGLPGLVQGVNVGPRDQTPAEERPDVLTYTSGPLREPLEVTGPVRSVLYASSTAPDTDFIVRLCDVHPDNTSRVLTEGVLRAQYREGYSAPSPIEPGKVYAFEIDMVATSNVFFRGHRIRVDITSSSFPYIVPNPNTGNPIGHDGPNDLRPALQSVFHDGQHPSHIVLPIIRG